MLVRDSADFYHFRFQRSQRRSYRRARHCSGREIYFGIFKRKISRLNALPQTSRWHFSKRDAAGMAWLPAESASVYHVEIDKEGVGPVYKKGGPRSGPSARSGTRTKELYLRCTSLDERGMKPHAGANNAYYSRKCARASLARHR